MLKLLYFILSVVQIPPFPFSLIFLNLICLFGSHKASYLTVIETAVEVVYGIHFNRQQKLPTTKSPCAIFYYAFHKLNSFRLFDTLNNCIKQTFDLKLFNFVKSFSVVFSSSMAVCC